MFGKVLPTLLLVVGVCCDFAEAKCKGTLHFKAPASWTSVYVMANNVAALIPASGYNAATGWWTYDLSLAGTEDQETRISLANSATAPLNYVTATLWDEYSQYDGNVPKADNVRNITCPTTIDGKIYIAQNDDGTIYIGNESPNAGFIYALVPDDKEWQSDFMMITADGGAGVQMTPAPNMCGWFMMVYEEVPDEVLIYRKNKPDEKIGQTGLWGNEAEPTPLPLKAVLQAFGTNSLYFIPDDSQWKEGTEDQQGLFISDPGVDGICNFNLAAVIYDTDQLINKFFSSDPDATNTATSGYSGTWDVSKCVGVRQNIVQAELGPDKKPKLNTSSTNGPACFENEAGFSTLFNYTPGVNEVVCYDLPFTRQKDGRWGFDSDSVKNGTHKGGFSPIENTTDASVVTMNGQTMGPTPAARRKRNAKGPVPNSIDANGGNLDYYCTTAGWTGTRVCEGYFASGGDGDTPGLNWCWGNYCAGTFGVEATWDRWQDDNAGDGVTGGRNQQFCFESHATFTYSEDQEFTFRGDDDIWVFIGGKLAVDNGGTHLAAPGHVVLKNLNNTYPGLLEPGNDYPIDIFFCDRRTDMSNVIIKTNMYIKQTSGLNANGSKNEDGSVNYSICYDQSGDGSCASVALGQAGGGDGTIHACGAEIAAFGNLKYRITTRAGVEVATLESGKAGWQYGGIDLSNQFSPKVNTEKINGLAPGSYRLVIDFCDANGACNEKARTYINFRIKGNLDVMTQTSTYVVNAGDEKSPHYASGSKWIFVDKGLAGSRVPVYVSAFADGGVDLLSAIGQKYTLVLDKGMVAYTSKTGDTQVTWPKEINQTGIDTIWVYQGLDGLNANPEPKTVSLKSQAVINFYAPRLDFAEPVSVDSTGKVTAWKHPLAGDPDSLDGEEYYHWIGSDVDLYVVVVDPSTNEICTDYVTSLTLVDASAGVSMPGEALALGDGAYIISIRSRKEYMDTTAYITISTAEDTKGLSLSSYTNMRFRKPPVPYPQLVDMFDVKGATLGALAIPEPYFSESREYLDGKADSIAIHYDRPFAPNPQGEYKDSLPFLICIDWDENVFEKVDFTKKTTASDTIPFSKTKKDTAVACSYMIDSVTIYNAFMARYNANGKKSDSVLTFVSDSVFSTVIKTAGRGKVLSFATYEDRKKITKGHFDGSVTDRIAPVIVSARVDNFSDQFNRLTVTLSEPVNFANADDPNKNAPFTFYMPSATEVAEANRYASPTAGSAPVVPSDKVALVFDKTQATKNPTPRLGDFIRFRADSWMWTDTANYASDATQRVASDADMHWNSPTDYNSGARLPSPWVTIVGDYSVEVSAIKLATMNRDIDAKNTPAVEVFTIPTTMGKEEIAALYPNTLGFIVKSDLASFMSKDSITEKYFNEHPEALEDVYFYYETQYFTNLGAYVAGNKQKIYCLDEMNKKKNGKEFFGGKDCRSVQGNFYIAWNMLSDKKRLVGTGAYIAKLTSYVKLAKIGKPKAGKAEETDMWGAKRGKGIVKK